ncbi:g10614 [Coccomyxa viridis]|uniref:G10614 protein n=1 Tax=Coccomyxa viridis TaxID=1274662 RepID=A0ABP1G8G8_9CHLO
MCMQSRPTAILQLDSDSYKNCKKGWQTGCNVSNLAHDESAKAFQQLPASEVEGGSSIITASQSPQSNIPEKQAKACIKAALDLITDEVSSGNRVSFTGFGAFEPRARAARKGTNPQTKEVMNLPASTTPGFTAGKAFKDKVNGSGKP